MVSPASTARYQYDYNRWSDWCAAHGHTPLPADPHVISQYLASEPATPSTQRGRLSAINWAHRTAGLPAPGRTPHLRETLNPTRAARTQRLHTLIDDILPRLPIWGWPAGLFGRRDAVLLHLIRSGLAFPHISSLTRRDIAVSPDHVAIGKGPTVVLAATKDDTCPVAAFRRWAAVLTTLEQPAAVYLLAHHLEQESLAEPTLPPAGGGPALFALDRDGNPDLKPAPLTPGSIGVIAAAHVLGRTPAHHPRKRRRADADHRASELVFESESPPLSNDYFDRGIAARRRGLDLLCDIEALLDAAEAKVDQIVRHQWDRPPVST